MITTLQPAGAPCCLYADYPVCVEVFGNEVMDTTPRWHRSSNWKLIEMDLALAALARVQARGLTARIIITRFEIVTLL